MRRADRLYRLVDLLRGGQLTTARRLAETLEVSERTIYRDIADLMASGVPIDGEAGVGYVMGPGFDVPPLMFDRKEVAALVAGARLIEAWGGAKMAQSASDAIRKIAAVVPDGIADEARSLAIQAFRPSDQPADAQDWIDELDTAIHTKTGLWMAYTDENQRRTERDIRPLGLVFWGKVWTLVAWCDLRGDFRLFRVDRITDLQMGAPFTLNSHQTLAAFYEKEAACSDMPE
ncbi:MAG: YafY family protein, partial [Pseudomonadota bacterium]